MTKPAERRNFYATSGRTFPPRHGAKRRAKDEANRWQRALTGRGPERTKKG